MHFMKKDLTRKDLAQHFQVDFSTVRNWEKLGKITPTFHLNGRPRYSKGTIEEMKKKSSNK